MLTVTNTSVDAFLRAMAPRGLCCLLCSCYSQELALKVLEIELPPEVMVHLLDEMSNTEERLSHGGSERLQLGSLVGAFATARCFI